jgi:hypothetical protein
MQPIDTVIVPKIADILPLDPILELDTVWVSLLFVV